MGNILLLFLVLFPMLLSAWVFPLRRRDRDTAEMADPDHSTDEANAACCTSYLLANFALEAPGSLNFGLRLQAGVWTCWRW